MFEIKTLGHTLTNALSMNGLHANAHQSGDNVDIVDFGAARRLAQLERLNKGVPFPQTANPTDHAADNDGPQLITVDGASNATLQQIAHGLAMVVKRDMGFAHPAWHRSETTDASQPHAFLLAQDNHAVGLLVSRRRFRWSEADWDANLHAVPVSPHDESRWSADIIWIARDYRGKGYGRLLINLALFHLEAEAQDMAWAMPFSEGGERLLRSLTGDHLFVA